MGEHLIFLGSEQYPYKGVLDSLANRCLARGTNAWTDVDHTCYTVEVAGSEGFLNLKSEVSKYERIVEWMKDLIFNTQFTVERLIITAQKLVNDAAQFKR